MINIIVIAVLLIVGVIAVKMNHLRHRIFIIMMILLAIFLYVSFYTVTATNNLDFKSPEGVINAVRVYLGWLANGFNNIKVLTGNAIKMDWTSTNGSFLNKTSNSV